ncbi:hypothetical protein RHECIAT_CH0001116 [Rhizobium etli CIAT 652]|uniref:Uncharacterized protein n=1 Tax=Rhizobium etli (strain CIAT 652) TaxID=491916 RepID=B3PST3_RHIE6|nr:hypothetical protein RHECIAT_CH0001116 [Rhizobium etli CIAT 652]
MGVPFRVRRGGGRVLGCGSSGQARGRRRVGERGLAGGERVVRFQRRVGAVSPVVLPLTLTLAGVEPQVSTRPADPRSDGERGRALRDVGDGPRARGISPSPRVRGSEGRVETRGSTPVGGGSRMRGGRLKQRRAWVLGSSPGTTEGGGALLQNPPAGHAHTPTSAEFASRCHQPKAVCGSVAPPASTSGFAGQRESRRRPDSSRGVTASVPAINSI